MWEKFLAQVTIPNPLGNTTNTFGDLLGNIITAVAGIIGALSVIMIIVAGILYLTSAGSPEKMTKAKTALIYAIAGIVITLLASGIVAIIRTAIGG
ncbi:MAG: pilin [Patescibacteria group bacterium]